MSAGAIRNLMASLRRASRAPGDAHLGDPQLLERFVRTRDEAAFNALLARHGPMVLEKHDEATALRMFAPKVEWLRARLEPYAPR